MKIELRCDSGRLSVNLNSRRKGCERKEGEKCLWIERELD
jgi:hypothetical protein